MNAEQEALLRKAEESIRAAKTLVRDNFPDFAIARAYYAMFYLAQALLNGKGLTFSKHGSTLSAFGLHFVKAGEVEAKFHQYLIKSFNLRLSADYEATTTLDKAQAEEQIIHAEEFLAMTENLLKT